MGQEAGDVGGANLRRLAVGLVAGAVMLRVGGVAGPRRLRLAGAIARDPFGMRCHHRRVPGFDLLPLRRRPALSLKDGLEGGADRQRCGRAVAAEELLGQAEELLGVGRHHLLRIGHELEGA